LYADCKDVCTVGDCYDSGSSFTLDLDLCVATGDADFYWPGFLYDSGFMDYGELMCGRGVSVCCREGLGAEALYAFVLVLKRELSDSHKFCYSIGLMSR